MTLKQLRKNAGFTQQELADKANLNIRLVQKYEKGDTKIGNMTLLTAVSVAKALGITAEELLMTQQEKEKNN